MGWCNNNGLVYQHTRNTDKCEERLLESCIQIDVITPQHSPQDYQLIIVPRQRQLAWQFCDPTHHAGP
jgi:hypothetical protein